MPPEKLNPDPPLDRKIVSKPPEKAKPADPISLSNPPLADFSNKRKPIRPLRWIIILIVLGASGFVGWKAYQMIASPEQSAPQAAPGIPVRLEELKTSTVRDSSEFVGTLEAVQIVEIRPEIEGRIQRILVREGQSVRAGQPIMVLKPDRTRPQYEAALAAVDVAKGNRENAVKQLEIAKTRLDTATAEHEIIAVYVPRLRVLVEEGALEQLRLDEVLQREIAARNEMLAAREQVQSAEVAVRQAEDSIRQSQSEANSTLVSLQLKEIYAPTSGVVDKLPTKLGDYVMTGQSVVATVVQTDSLFLNIAVPANRSAQLRENLKVELKDPTSQAKLATGRLTFISPLVNPDGQTILAKANFLNFGGKLRHGQNVQARIVWATRSGLSIPTTAVSQIGGKPFVFLVSEERNENEQEIVRLAPVELGDIQSGNYQVISGLEAGDRIAVSNILKLRDGVPIQSEL